MDIFKRWKKEDAEEDKAKDNNEDGIFLDTIIRKNGIRQLKDFQPSDIESLKSLLNVSAGTMWLKGSKEQSEMQKDYKNFYKKVSKPLDSLYKHCFVIRKYNTEDLEKKINNCNDRRINIEKITYDAAKKLDAVKELEDARTPTNIMAIEELNKLTENFNELRASDKYRFMIIQANVNIHVETYKEFEKRMRIAFKTKDPVVRINQFVQEKKQLKEKESREVFLSVLREKKNDIKVAQSNVFKVLGELESTVGLVGGSLEKYLVNKNDFIAINKGLYDKLIDALTKKIKAQCGEVDEREFKSKVKEEINKYLGKIQKEMEKPYEEKDSVERLFDGTKQYAKILWKFILSTVKDYMGANDEKNDDAPNELNATIKNEIEEFCDTWVRFEMVHGTLANKINYRETKKEILEDFLKDYEKYINGIVNASKEIGLHLSKTLEDMKNNKAFFNEHIQRQIALFNKNSCEIDKSVSSLRTEYIAARSDSKAIKKIIKGYVETYKDQFGDALNGKEISNWQPPASCSKLTLAQAVLFVYYCVDQYEDCWKFGLSNKILEYLERNEKLKLGMTAKEIKKIIGTSKEKRG